MSLKDKLNTVAGEVAEAEGVELYLLEFKKTGKNRLLRVYIDSDEGISHRECVEVSKHLGTRLDVEDLISHRYTLEVSSPGLDRPLVRNEHFEKQIGKQIEVRTYGPIDGEKYFKGELKEYSEKGIVLERQGEETLIPRDAVSRANLVVEI